MPALRTVMIDADKRADLDSTSTAPTFGELGDELAPWQTASCADARALAAWVDRILAVRGLGADELGEANARCIYRWRVESRRAALDAVERVVCRLGYHVSELPDSLWLEGPPRGRRAAKVGGER